MGRMHPIMENGPFIDGLPVKHGDFFYSYISHYQRVLDPRDPQLIHGRLVWICKRHVN